MIAEDELQARVRSNVYYHRYMITITTSDSFVHFCIVTHILFV